MGDARGQMRAAVARQPFGPCLQRTRQRQVQRRALAGQQVVDDHLAQQRVAERVEALVVGDDELRGDGLAHGHARIEGARRGQDLVVQPLAGREHAQQLLRVRGEPLDPQHQRVTQGRRERAAPVRPGREQLLGEQRVAFRAREQAPQQVAARRLAEDVRELLAQLVARERPQLDAAGARVALQLGEQRAQGMAAVQLVRPVGRHHQHALAAQRRSQVDEERPRGAVGPVQVLDRQQQPVLAREQLQQLQQTVEQPRLRGGLVVRARLGAPEAGQDLRERGPRGR